MPDFIKIPDKSKLYSAANTDAVDVAVGGKNVINFAPSVNVSFKFKTGEEQCFFNICDDIEQIKTVGKEEDWKGNKLKIKDGDVESTFELFESSLKIERIFYVKPITAPKYKLTYSTGISFYYQPELTAEEIEEGLYRPDNVVGSYAVYYDKAGHYKNSDGSTKVDYGSGKIGHLYAPYWVDSVGSRIKGTQRIDKNFLIFDLPSDEWLDTAVYPIKLDPDLGYTTAGASEYTLNAYRYGTKNTTGVGESGRLESISVAWKSTNTAYDRVIGLGLYEGASPPSSPTVAERRTLRGVLYDSKASEPSGFMSIDFSANEFDLSESTDYWIGFQGYDGSWSAPPGAYAKVYYDSGTKQTNRVAWSLPWVDLATSFSTAYLFSVFLTYTADTTGSTLLPINFSAISHDIFTSGDYL